MKIKEYVLRVIIDEDGDELIHLSERYDCDDYKYKYKFEIKGEIVEAPDDLQDSLNELEDSSILGVA